MSKNPPIEQYAKEAYDLDTTSTQRHWTTSKSSDPGHIWWVARISANREAHYRGLDCGQQLGISQVVDD
ncbi:MAG: hypothetical protein HOH43_00305 [Candidatus Latescibacteria bacterium]|nr:hypothetical protein [Candidatus Latescibacterota bacterium]